VISPTPLVRGRDAELALIGVALFDDADPLLERSGLRELHSAPEQRYWLLQDLLRDRERPDTAAIAVAVLEAWQGRGVGKALLRHVSSGAGAVELVVSPHPSPSVSQGRSSTRA
jgi:GNAT superfamily N-acetyltransferase